MITNGLVMDGSGMPAFTADVGIADGRIQTAGEVDTMAVREVLDARGHVVAPGFIDPHTPTTRRSSGTRSRLRRPGTGSTFS